MTSTEFGGLISISTCSTFNKGSSNELLWSREKLCSLPDLQNQSWSESSWNLSHSHPPPQKKTQTNKETKSPFKFRQCKTQAMAGYVLVGLSHTAFTFSRTSDKAYSGMLWSQGFLKYYFKQKIFLFKNNSCYYFEEYSKLLKKMFSNSLPEGNLSPGLCLPLWISLPAAILLKVKFTETCLSWGGWIPSRVPYLFGTIQAL